MVSLSQKRVKGIVALCFGIAFALDFSPMKVGAQSQSQIIISAPPAISFSDLSGTNLQPYLGSVEVTSGGTFPVPGSRLFIMAIPPRASLTVRLTSRATGS